MIKIIVYTFNGELYSLPVCEKCEGLIKPTGTVVFTTEAEDLATAEVKAMAEAQRRGILTIKGIL